MPRLQFAIADTWWNKRDGKEETAWVSCTVFGARALGLRPLLEKGTYVCVQGTIRQRKWEDEQEGVKVQHHGFSVMVREMTFRNTKRIELPRDPLRHDDGVVPFDPSLLPSDDDMPY
jgi:single-stranded DNA-binding protein